MEKTETQTEVHTPEDAGSDQSAAVAQPKPAAASKVEEIGGPKGPDPTRFGDWTVNGRCVDF